MDQWVNKHTPEPPDGRRPGSQSSKPPSTSPNWPTVPYIRSMMNTNATKSFEVKEVWKVFPKASGTVVPSPSRDSGIPGRVGESQPLVPHHIDRSEQDILKRCSEEAIELTAEHYKQCI